MHGQQKVKHYFMFNNFLFFGNRALYEMWKNILQPDSPRMTI